MQTPITFESDGLTLAGTLHTPDGGEAAGPRPGFVFLHGFGTSMRGAVDVATCEMLAGWGYAALRFDFRGCGESEGERGNVICLEEVADARNARACLAARDDVDGNRIAVMGHSFGAAVAVYAGAVDPGFAAVVSSCGWGNGELKFRRQHEGAAWARFASMLVQGKRRREETGESPRIPRFDIVPIPEPLRAHLPPDAAAEFTLETVESMLSFNAEEVAARIAPRPLLLLHAADDSVTPTEQSLRLFERAGQPTDLVLLSDVDHWPFAGERPRARDILRRWLDVYLPAGP